MAGSAVLQDLLPALRRQAWLVALILAVGLPLAYAFAQSRPKTYEAIAVIEVEPPQVQIDPASGATAAAGIEANAEIDLIRQSLMARPTMAGMVDSLGLFPDLDTPTERIAAAREAVTLSKITDPAQAWRSDAIATGLSISVRLDDPEAAAAYANAVLDWIIADTTARTQARADRTLQFLIAEETRIGAAIAAVEARIADFRAANVQSLPDGLTSQRDRLASLQDQMIELRQEIVDAEASSLRSGEAERQTSRLAEREQVIAAAIADTEAAIAAAPGVERELASLGRELAALEAELDVITTRRAQAAMQATLQANNEAGRYTALERAEVPDFAVSASRRKIALAGAAAVVALALAAAVARELMPSTIRTASQMRAQTGLDPLIVIPTLQRPGAARRRAWRAATVATAVLIGLAVVSWPGIASPFA